MPGIDAFADRLSSYLGPDQVNLVRRAYYYAEQAHDGQRRRSGEPYVTHPLAVSNILADMHMDHQSLMAAMLHDVIEDTGIAKEALTAQFGETVSELVDGVSKLTQMNFETKAEAQAENFQKMAMAMARDIRVILVKLADRLHNMRTLEVLSGDYQSLHTTLFGMHGVPIEIQIRTREMEEMANHGIAAHWLYKSNDETPKGTHARARQWVKGVLELQQRAGNSLEFIENVKIDLFPDEVYVFTPKGRIMELPKGSTAVDFAYAVHTDVGNSCIACRINRRLAPLSEPLQSGQTVEIVTAPGARPNPAWLSFVVTGKARTHIRHALKLQRRSESINLGERLLNKTLTGFDSHLEKIPQERIQAVLAEYRMEVFEDLLEEIGLGNRMAYVVARRLLSSEGEEAPSAEGPLAIRGTEGLVLSYAKCCTPIPGDPIVGHLSAGKGMVVHLESCKNISEVRHNPEKCIQLSWAKDVTGEFNVELRVELEHQRGLIALLATSVNAADGNIEKISMDERDGRISVVQLVVSVHDRVHLARVIKKLRALKGVIRITRLRS